MDIAVERVVGVCRFYKPPPPVTSVAVTTARAAEVMPHASEDGGAAGEDACSSDELIVFKDEDGGEDVVKRSSDKVTEEKSDLIDLSESEVNTVTLYDNIIIVIIVRCSLFFTFKVICRLLVF